MTVSSGSVPSLNDAVHSHISDVLNLFEFQLIDKSFNLKFFFEDSVPINQSRIGLNQYLNQAD